MPWLRFTSKGGGFVGPAVVPVSVSTDDEVGNPVVLEPVSAGASVGGIVCAAVVPVSASKVSEVDVIVEPVGATAMDVAGVDLLSSPVAEPEGQDGQFLCRLKSPGR